MKQKTKQKKKMRIFEYVIMYSKVSLLGKLLSGKISVKAGSGNK